MSQVLCTREPPALEHSASGFLAQVTPLVLTFNEASNIARTLQPLAGFRRVVVMDSGSTDGTLEIVRSFPNTVVYHRAFDCHANQWNHALHHTQVDTPWVLALDADYCLSPSGVRELAVLQPAPHVHGYRASFRYLVCGQPLSRTLYPPVVVLYRRDGARYVQDGHTQRIEVQGVVEPLNERIDHDDRKPLARWLTAQARYAALEVPHILTTPWAQLGWPDRLRRLLVVTPWLVPLYCLLWGRGLRDGWAGMHYALQRGVAETILSLLLIESRWGRR